MKITTRVIEDPAGYPDAPIGSLAWRRWFATETKLKRRDIQQQAGEIASRIISMRDGNYHETFNLPDFDTFCQKVLELAPDQVQAILSAKPWERVSVILGGHGGDRRSEEAKAKKDQADIVSLKTRTAGKIGGNSREYLKGLLTRDGFHDIVARVDAGEISARAGAIEAGIIEVKTPLEKAQAAFTKLSRADRKAFTKWVSEQVEDLLGYDDE